MIETNDCGLIGRRAFLVGSTFMFAASAGCKSLRPMSPGIELTALVSGGFSAAFRTLTPAYQRANGALVHFVGGPSMGNTPQAIPARLARHEQADIVILAREALDRLVLSGSVATGTVTDLAHSRIALAVRQGHPRPDVGSEAALRHTLLSAQSIAYSDSASGVYVSTKLFARLGIVEAMASKAKMIAATPVGEIVARGEAEIGFQQLSELKPVAGIDIIGLLPEHMQKVTTFSAGIVSYTRKADDARNLIAFLSSPASIKAIRDSGMEPA